MKIPNKAYFKMDRLSKSIKDGGVSPSSDENFQFIAGHTNNRCPYGITWEEAKLMEKEEKLKATKKEDRIKNGGPCVDLKELMDAFTMQSDDITYYVNHKSGEIVPLIQDMEEEDETSNDILYSDDYIALPSSYELNIYAIMEEFIFSLQDIQMQKVLASVIIGKGAFRRFKETVKAYSIENQ